MGNPFVIFGFMVWFLVTVAAWIIGLAGLFAGFQDGDPGTAAVGGGFLLGGVLSTSFFLASLG